MITLIMTLMTTIMTTIMTTLMITILTTITTTLPLQVVMLDLKSIICAGFSCMLHLQAMAEEVGGLPAHMHTHAHTCTRMHSHAHTCTHLHSLPQVTIKALICLVDKKTGEKSKTRPRFIKQDQIAIAR